MRTPCYRSFFVFSPRFSFLFFTVVLLILNGGFATTARATTRTWTGAGSNGTWTNATNWGGSAPVAGDDLVFPGVLFRLSNTNTFPTNTVFSSVRFTGTNFAIYGNPFILTNSLTATNAFGTNAINNSITFSNVDLTVTVGGGANLNLNGVLSGSVGLTKIGQGTLTFANTSGSNPYTGTTKVNAGTLILNVLGSSAFGGALVIGDDTGAGSPTVRIAQSTEINDAAAITINGGAVLDLNNFNEAVGPLTLKGGSISTGSGTLTMTADATVNSSTIAQASISGLLALGSATRTFTVASHFYSPDIQIAAAISGTGGFTKAGTGELGLYASNSYSGLTTVSAGSLELFNAFSLGTTNGGTVINGGGLFLFSGTHIGLESLTNNGGFLDARFGSNSWGGPIVLATNTQINVSGATDYLTITGNISGTGGVTKTGAGTLLYNASSGINTYVGTTTVNTGTLLLNVAGAISFEGPLVIGDGSGSGNPTVRLLQSTEIYDSSPITIKSNGLLNLNNFSEIVSGSLTIDGGAITTGAGTLTLANGNTVTVANGVSISGKLNLGTTTSAVQLNGPLYMTASVSGSSSITAQGPSGLYLYASNSFTGPLTLNGGYVEVLNTWALGATNGNTTLNNDAQIDIEVGGQILGEALVLNSTNPAGSFYVFTGPSDLWSGDITLGAPLGIYVASNVTMDLSCTIHGTGGLTKYGPGSLIFSGVNPNSYTGTTTVNEGTLSLSKPPGIGAAVPGALVIGDGSGGVNADKVQLQNDEQINGFAAVTINSSGKLDVSIFDQTLGSLSGSGNITLENGGGPQGDIYVGANDASTFFSGVISGDSGQLWKLGSGTLTLSGNNTYNGTTEIQSGKLIINGSQPASTVDVNSGGTLGGSGTVGPIVVSAGGTIAPGSSPGILTSSNVFFSASSTFEVELNGTTPGTGYDQLNVLGTNNLGGATLNLSFGGGFAPELNKPIVILTNDGVEPIVGTFNGLPEGSLITNGARVFQISYAGGSGNDVALKLINTPMYLNGLLLRGGNGNSSIDPDECNHYYIWIYNSTTNTATGVTASISSRTPGAIVTQPYSSYPDIAPSSIGLNSRPFQISVLPSIACGSTIEVLFTFNSSLGNFSVPYGLLTGQYNPVSSANNTPLFIADNGTTDSTNIISDFNQPISKVTVSLFLTHTFDSDLVISLIAPDNTSVLLSSHNGSSGDNYGSSCNDRTLFADSAGTPITSGTAPFVGTYQPQGSLSSFNGKSGTNVNGAWKLRITDTTGGDTGALICWTLNLFGPPCTPGGGACETCPGLITNSISPSDSVNGFRLNRNGGVSSCETPKVCPGGGDDPGTLYDVHNFTNSGASACVTVYLQNSCALFASAYLGAYQPVNFCNNYLGDMGYNGNEGEFSFAVPANTNFCVVVNNIPLEGGGTCDYKLFISGLECPPPALNLTRLDANNNANIRLDWPTSAAGYILESTPSLAPTNWTSNFLPITTDGRYTVTNGSISPVNKFYRLRKP